MLSKSRDFCAPKAWTKCKKEDLGGKKTVLKQKKNGVRASFLFLFLVAMLNTESGLRFSAVQNWLLIKKERNSETFSFWQIYDWKGSVLYQVQLSCKIYWSEKLKKCMCKKYGNMQHNILASILSQSNWSS